MLEGSLLSIITFVPLIGAVILALFLRGDDEAAQSNAKWAALFASGVSFAASFLILGQFDPSLPDFQFVEERSWIVELSYRVGLDGVSVLFVMLTTFVMPLVVMASWSVTHRVKELMIALLTLETMVLGTFGALDMVLFYLFFVGAFVPVFMIIGIWGGADRVAAALKFVLFGGIGAALLLVAMVVMTVESGTTCIGGCGEEGAGLLRHSFDTATIVLLGNEVSGGMQTLLWLAFFAAFAVAAAIWPFHVWLPSAQFQAPTAAGLVIAALMLKVGSYGLLRFSIPMFPVATDLLAGAMMWLGAIAVIFGALAALVQDDMRRLVAYASLAHVGVVTVGLFALNRQSVDGAVFHMLSHGVIVTGMLVCLSALNDRKQSYDITAYGGLSRRVPMFTAAFLLFSLGLAGVPGTAGFVGFFLTVIGVLQANTWVALVLLIGAVGSAAYALRLFRMVAMGDLIKEGLKTLADLSLRERLILGPIAAVTVLLGVYPAIVTDITGPAVEALLADYRAAVDAARDAD